jgi:hypothetical protein
LRTTLLSKFATGINHTSSTGGKIYAVVYTGDVPWCEYFFKFLKKFEMVLMLFSGAWGKMIHEKKLNQKILWHCPFKAKHQCT